MKSIALKENKDFRRLYHRGRSFVSPYLVTYVMKNREGVLRYGITAGKKAGNAVHRNRAKRLIREAYRSLEGRINGGYDFVFVARSKTCEAKMQSVLSAMEEQLKQSGVIKD